LIGGATRARGSTRFRSIDEGQVGATIGDVVVAPSEAGEGVTIRDRVVAPSDAGDGETIGDGVVAPAGAGFSGRDGAGAGVSVGVGVGDGAGALATDLFVFDFGFALALLFDFGLLGTITTWPVTIFIKRNRLITHTDINTVAFDLRLSISDLYIVLMAPA